MALVIGTRLTELMSAVDRAASAIPGRIGDFLNRFAAIQIETTASADATFYHGRMQLDPTPDGTLGGAIDLGFGKLRSPSLADGIPFQLAFPRRAPDGATVADMEPAADRWRLDLVLDLFDLELDGLRPARLVPEAGTVPRHLVRDPSGQKVRLSGGAVLRLEKAGPDADVVPRLIHAPDPLDPLSASGFVASVTMTPPHVFIGGSQFGLTVTRLLYDGSETFTPPEIMQRGQPASWQGLLIDEATVYLPRHTPALGGLSAGVRDLLIGSPMGLQGQLEIQFGRTALAPSTFQFAQIREDGPTSLAIGPDTGSVRERVIEIQAVEGMPARISAALNASEPQDDDALSDWSADWRWPTANGSILTTGDSSTGSVMPGQTLRVVPFEMVAPGSPGGEAQRVNHPEISFRFVSAGTAPSISIAVTSGTFENVLSLSGTKEDLEELTLTAADEGAGGDFTWRIDGEDGRTQDADFPLDVGDLTGRHIIVLEQKDDQDIVVTSRVELTVLTEGRLLVGTEDGVFAGDDAATPLPLSAVVNTYDLSDFHGTGDSNTNPIQANLTASAPFVTVPADGLAHVTITSDTNGGGTLTPPPPVPRDRVVTILFANDHPKQDGTGTVSAIWATGEITDDERTLLGPAAEVGRPAYSATSLRTWAAQYPGANFLVVGRCSDVASANYNRGLAARRAEFITAHLTADAADGTSEAIAASRVALRGEQNQWTTPSGWSGPLPDEAEENPDLGLTEDEQSDVAEGTPRNGWLIEQRSDYDRTDTENWPPEHDPSHQSEQVRRLYRRVDVYASGGAPVPETVIPDDSSVTAQELRRALVPATGRDPAPASSGTPDADFRVKLVIAWDSPTVSSWYDAVPTLAEAEFAWSPNETPLPEVDGDEVDLSREIFTLQFKWVHDVRTGYTLVTAGLKSEGDEDGLFAIENDVVTTALALGPALLSGMDADTDALGAGARMSALVGGIAALNIPIAGRPLIGDASRTVVNGFGIEAELASIANIGTDEQYRIVADYVCTLHIDGEALGLKTAADRPVKIRYKRVGIEYDTSAGDDFWERIGLVFDTNTLEIEDPGKWEIDGVLGSLLRISEMSMGRGSFWIEGTISIAAELGVVEISEATIRLTWHDGSPNPKFEVRGFKAKVDIPSTLKGEGRLRIEDGGLIRAGVDCEVIPAKLKASAAIAFAKKTVPDPYIFLSLHVGVQFATPLPLAQSGLAIYGLRGTFVMNGERKLPDNPDPIARELAWFDADPEDKYDPKLGQYALGFGAVVGTMPDASFMFSCEGMLSVGFPDPEVIFGVKVNVVSIPDTEVSDSGDGSEAAIRGLIVIDDEAVKVGVIAEYKIPKLIEVTLPFSAYFPYPGSGEYVYIRVGSDGYLPSADNPDHRPRYGEPVTIKLLPGTLDVEAWAYLMIEAGGLPYLGGREDFSFDGFSVGFGAGFGIEWKAGPIELSASASVLAGFGTRPLLLKAGLFVEGRLSLVILSISVRGELTMCLDGSEGVDDPKIYIEGEFCGEVDMWFFSISGCVGISIGDDSPPVPPEPPAPVSDVTLIDRHDRIMGRGVTGGAPLANPISPTPADIEESDENAIPTTPDARPNHTVWPDTTPVINFSHFVENGLPSDSQFAHIPGNPSGPKWFGASELKYAYRLDQLILRKRGGAEVADPDGNPLDCAWRSSPDRPRDGADGYVPGDNDTQSMALLSWDGDRWPLNLPDGGEGQPGDPANYIERICDPLPAPMPLCLYGKDARHLGLYGMRIPAPARGPEPYASRYAMSGEPAFGSAANRLTGQTLRAFLAGANAFVLPGAVENLSFPTNAGGETLTRGYRLPGARFTRPSGFMDIPLPWSGHYDGSVVDPELTLLVCDAPTQAKGVDRPGGREDCDEFTGLKVDTRTDRIDRPSFLLRPAGAGTTAPALLTTTDSVDQSRNTPVSGRDGNGEVVVPNAGLRIELKRACRRVQVHVMLFKESAIKAESRDAQGRLVENASTPRTTRVPHILTFEASASDDPIVEISLFGGEQSAVVYKICCVTEDIGTGQDCENLFGLRPSGQAGPVVRFKGLTFTAIDRRQTLSLLDSVDQRGGVARRGSDGSAEVGFPEKGVAIDLASPCDVVDVHVMLFAGPVKGEAENADGDVIAGDNTPQTQSRPHILHFEGKDITRVVLRGGNGEAVVYRICCLDKPQDDDTTIVTGGLQDGVVVVRGVARDTGATAEWRGRVRSSHMADKRRCQVISYKPAPGSAPAWQGVEIAAPPGKIIHILSNCAVDEATHNRREEDEAARAERRDAMDEAGARPPEARHRVLLEPDTQYEIEIRWSWQAWPSEGSAETLPATPPEDDWAPASEPQLFRFATAAQTEEALGEVQDGLNEYIFDARDIGRYLLATEPSGTRAAHFTADPLWAHFSPGHVEQLAAAYGRTLTIEIARTDPPPVSGGDLSASTAPLAFTLLWRELVRYLLSTGQERLNAAADAASCIGKPPYGGASAEIRADLEPDASYDMLILAVDDSLPEDRRRVEVARTHFHTSRYSGPDALLTAAGYDEMTNVTAVDTAAPLPPEDYILPEGASLPTGDLRSGDMALDAALEAIGLGTLPSRADSTGRPASIAIWQQAGADWRLAGVLIDHVEPLVREQTVQAASADDPDFGTRFDLTHMELSDRTRLDPVRANESRTRMLFTPAAPRRMTASGEHALTLSVTVPASPEHPGGTLRYGRRIGAVPALIAEEGL
ncbi:MAG: hypothetical protein WA979_08970 [Pacificimonas sp.]